jgi:hypothetical protein
MSSKGKAWLIILGLVVLFFVILFGAGSGGSRELTYKVTSETDLYSSLQTEDTMATLKAGTIVIPAAGRATLECDSKLIESVKMQLCKVLRKRLQ